MLSRNMSRREWLRLCAWGGASVLLSSCGAPVEPTKEVTSLEPTVATEPAQTGYQGKFVILSTREADEQADLIQAIEAAHPGVEVEWRFLEETRFTELFAAAEVAGDQIDILDLNGQDYRRYALGGQLKELSDIAYLDRFQDVCLRTARDKLYALPRGGIDGFVIFYNKKALEKIGVTDALETYDQLLEIQPELVKADIIPMVYEGKVIYMWPVWFFFAHAQTAGNKSIEHAMKTLSGEMKFTDPEYVEALEIVNRYARDGMFIDSVLSLDFESAWLEFSQGNVAFWYDGPWRIKTWREGDYPDLDLDLMPPFQHVASAKRELPGATGLSAGIYSKIAPEREEVALSILDQMTSDEWVLYWNKIFGYVASCNKGQVPDDDPLAIKFSNECAPLRITFEDWIWPPEVTRAFQENLQAIVAGTVNPDEGAKSIQKVMDDLYKDGYTFEM